MNADDSMTFNEIVQMIKAKYDFDARREQVLTQVYNLNLKKHIEDQITSNEYEGMNASVNIIHRITPQFTRKSCAEKHNITHFLVVVIYFSWSETTIWIIFLPKYSVTEFFLQLLTHKSTLKETYRSNDESYRSVSDRK